MIALNPTKAPETLPRNNRPMLLRAFPHSAWLLFAVIIGYFHVMTTGETSETTLAIVSSIIGLQSIYGFIVQGGRRINASSVVIYAIILFAVFPALYASRSFGLYADHSEIEALVTTVVLAGVLQTLLLTICPPRHAPHISVSNAQLSARAGTTAIFLLALTLVLSFDIVSPLQSATGILAIFFAALAAVTSKSRAGLAIAMVLLTASVLFYSAFVFDGFGRLMLGVIGFGILMLLTLRFPGYLIKVGVLAASAPAIMWMSYQRIAFLEESRGMAVAETEGLGSVIGPFGSAAVIIDQMQDGILEPSLGTTVFAALVVFIPSAIWSSKPVGFGTEMVPVTAPELAHVVGYSDAGLLIGEAVWNFGIWGSVFLFVLFCFGVRALDYWFAQTTVTMARMHQPNLAMGCQIVLIVALSSGLLNLFWGGLHTYSARLFVIIPVVGMIWLLSKVLTEARAVGQGARPVTLLRRVHPQRSR